jgi:hypothetical protein
MTPSPSGVSPVTVHFSRTQLAYGAALGALGGAAGALLGEALIRIDAGLTITLLCSALYAACIGAAIGAAAGLKDLSWEKSKAGATFGGLFGVVGGLAGGAVGQAVYASLSQAGFALIGRSLGWLLVGLCVGGSVGASTRSLRKGVLGAIGGLLGGYLGGGIFELADRVIAGESTARFAALVLTGAFIGAMMTLIEEMVKTASLTVLNGRLEGVRLPLMQNETRLGSLSRADIALGGYEGVVRDHVRVRRNGPHFQLALSEDAPGVTVNGEAVKEALLNHGDCIQMGKARLLFELHGTQPAAKPRPRVTARAAAIKPPVSAPGRPTVPVPVLVTPAADTPRLELGTGHFKLTGELTKIGSHISNDLVLEATDAAAFHAEIRVVKGRRIIFAIAEGATLHVNDRETRENLLKDGFWLQIGKRKILYRERA